MEQEAKGKAPSACNAIQEPTPGARRVQALGGFCTLQLARAWFLPPLVLQLVPTQPRPLPDTR